MEIGRPKVREQDGDGGGWGWVGYLNSLTHDWVVGVVCDCLGVVAFDIVVWSQQLYVRFFFCVFFARSTRASKFWKGNGPSGGEARRRRKKLGRRRPY